MTKLCFFNRDNQLSQNLFGVIRISANVTVALDSTLYVVCIQRIKSSYIADMTTIRCYRLLGVFILYNEAYWQLDNWTQSVRRTDVVRRRHQLFSSQTGVGRIAASRRHARLTE